MSDLMKYNHGNIDGHSAALQASSAGINSTLEDLKSQLRALEANWEGSGSEAYRQLKTQWDQAAAGLNATLAKISQVVGAGNAAMSATDRSVAGSFGG